MIISVLYPSWLHSAQFISVLVHNEEDFSGFLITSLDADKTLLNLTQLLHGRYAVYNVEYSTGEGDRSKVVFFLWAPDSSKVKSKMLYAGSKDTLRKALQGVNVEIQGTDKGEIEWQAVVDNCKSKSK